jgi:hypothetical protein
MRIDTLKKRLHAEFEFSEAYDYLEDEIGPGAILLTPHFKDRQRPWMLKAYQQWLRGDRTIVLVAPLKTSCKYFKKYVIDVAEIRPVKDSLTYDDQRVTNPMIIAVYRSRPSNELNFTVTFD